MNEHKEQMGFYLVWPSMISNEIFQENYSGKFTVILPNEIYLDEEFHREMVLAEFSGLNRIFCQSVKICGTGYKSRKGKGKGKENTFQVLCFTV